MTAPSGDVEAELRELEAHLTFGEAVQSILTARRGGRPSAASAPLLVEVVFSRWLVVEAPVSAPSRDPLQRERIARQLRAAVALHTGEDTRARERAFADVVAALRSWVRTSDLSGPDAFTAAERAWEDAGFAASQTSRWSVDDGPPPMVERLARLQGAARALRERVQLLRDLDGLSVSERTSGGSASGASGESESSQDGSWAPSEDEGTSSDGDRVVGAPPSDVVSC